MQLLLIAFVYFFVFVLYVYIICISTWFIIMVIPCFKRKKASYTFYCITNFILSNIHVLWASKPLSNLFLDITCECVSVTLPMVLHILVDICFHSFVYFFSYTFILQYNFASFIFSLNSIRFSHFQLFSGH